MVGQRGVWVVGERPAELLVDGDPLEGLYRTVDFEIVWRVPETATDIAVAAFGCRNVWPAPAASGLMVRPFPQMQRSDI